MKQPINSKQDAEKSKNTQKLMSDDERQSLYRWDEEETEDMGGDQFYAQYPSHEVE